MWDQVRKFGLEYSDLPTTLWNVSVFLRALTLNINSKDKKPIPCYTYAITIAMALCYFYAYLISMIWFVFVWSPKYGDLVGAIVVLSLGISSEIGILKLGCMFIYIDKIRKITDESLEFDAQVVPGSRYSKILLQSSRTVKKRAMLYWAVLIMNAVVYIMRPILTPGRHLTEDAQIVYGLEPMFESPNFEIAWIVMAAGVSWISYISANVTAYLIVITGYAESQMLALSDELTNLWSDANTRYVNQMKEKRNIQDELEIENITYDDKKMKIINEYVKDGLKKIIKSHAIIRSLLHQVEDVFRGAIALGFVLLLFGLIAELLAGLEHTYLQLPFAFMQVGVDCYTGQKVMDAGIIFERAVYNSKWENFNTSNRKIILIMLQISQKTVTLSAGGVTMLSFSCLMTTMRATYSAYTALRSTMD